MSEKSIKVCVATFEFWKGDGEISLAQFAQWVGDATLKIPEALRGSAYVVIDETPDGGELDLWYLRPETAEEERERLALHGQFQEYERTRDRQIIDSLKARHGWAA